MKTPEANARHIRELRARRFKVNRALVLEDKRRRGCCFCPGKSFPPHLLHYDHLDKSTKVATIASMMRWSTPRLLLEMAKCRIVCADHHRERHAWDKFTPGGSAP